jgi:hypothetical protein
MFRQLFIFNTALAAWVLMSGGVAWADVKGDPAPIGVATEGYLQNRQSFAFLTCRFRIINATAKTVEDAFQGNYLERQAEVAGYWVEHGSKKRFQLGCDPALIDQAKKRGDERPPCPTRDYVTDGKYRIDLRINLKSANIRPPGLQHDSSCELNPLDMSLCDPAETLQAAMKGHASFVRFDGTQKVGEAEAMVFFRSVPDYYNETFFMDPKRGFLPIQEISASHKAPDGQLRETMIMRMLDIRRCSRDRWFPIRSIKVNKSVNPQGPHHVSEFQVLDLDVDNPPPDSAFDMVIPAGYQVFNIAKKDWLIVLPKDERVRIDELASVDDRFAAIANAEWEKQKSPQTRPIAQPSWWLIPLVIAIVIGVLLFAASMVSPASASAPADVISRRAEHGR